ASLITALILLAFAPGRLRRGWALLLLAVWGGGCVPALSVGVGGLPNGAVAPPEGSVRTGCPTLIRDGGGAGAGVWLARRVLAALGESTTGAPRVRLVSGGLLAGLAIAGLIAAALPVGSRVDEVKRQYRDFTQLRQVDPGQVRLVSGGGNRYD